MGITSFVNDKRRGEVITLRTNIILSERRRNVERRKRID
jgi:hypothetical protein